MFVQVPRPAGGARQGDKTREILGASLLAREDSEDSAIGETGSYRLVELSHLQTTLTPRA